MMAAIKYEIGKSYPLRNGGRAVIGYVFENGNAYGIYSNDARSDLVCPMVWLPSGKAEHYENPDAAFHILPPEPEKRTIFVNVGRDAVGGLYIRGEHDTREGAEAHGGEPRVGCHRIELRAEFEEDAP